MSLEGRDPCGGTSLALIGETPSLSHVHIFIGRLLIEVKEKTPATWCCVGRGRTRGGEGGGLTDDGGDPPRRAPVAELRQRRALCARSCEPARNTAARGVTVARRPAALPRPLVTSRRERGTFGW